MTVAGALLTSMYSGTAPRTICRVSTTKSLSVWSGISRSARRSSRTCPTVCSLAYDDHVLRHETADGILIVVSGVLQPGTVLCRQRLGHLVEHVFWGLAGEKCQIVGVECAKGGHELLAVQLLDERATNRLARLDQRGSGLRWLELPKHQQAIVCGQRIENHRDVGRMLEPQVTLQFGEVLAMLHLLEEIVPRGLLAAGERGQDAMALEKSRDLIA